MWTISVKAAQSELNESELPTDARIHSERTNERTHHRVIFLNL